MAAAVERGGFPIDEVWGALFIPQREQGRLEFDRFLQQSRKLRADTSWCDEDVSARYVVSTDECVIAELAYLEPDVGRSERVVVMLALEVIPWAAWILGVQRRDDVASHIASATGSLNQPVFRQTRCPFVDEALPVRRREELEPLDRHNGRAGSNLKRIGGADGGAERDRLRSRLQSGASTSRYDGWMRIWYRHRT